MVFFVKVKVGRMGDIIINSFGQINNNNNGFINKSPYRHVTATDGWSLILIEASEKKPNSNLYWSK